MERIHREKGHGIVKKTIDISHSSQSIASFARTPFVLRSRGPNVNAPRTGDVLKRGDVFEASVVARGEGSR